MDLLIMALGRMRRLALWIGHATWQTPELLEARRSFLAACPTLQQLRDTLEHFDAYVTGTGDRQARGETPSEWGFVPGPDGSIIYGNHELRIGPAIEAAGRLRAAIHEAVDPMLARAASRP